MSAHVGHGERADLQQQWRRMGNGNGNGNMEMFGFDRSSVGVATTILSVTPQRGGPLSLFTKRKALGHFLSFDLSDPSRIIGVGDPAGPDSFPDVVAQILLWLTTIIPHTACTISA